MTPEPCNPDRLPAERLAFVEEIQEQFLQTLGQTLTTDLDTPVKATAGGIEQLPVADFLAGAAQDACAIVFELTPMHGQAWAGLSAGLVFRVLDILLNAPQPAAPPVRSSVTDIEKHLLREFFQSLERALDRAWSASGISLRLLSAGNGAEISQAAEADGTALILNCKLKFGEEEESFRVAIPVLAVRLAALESERKAAGEANGETAARAAVLETLGGATLELEAVLSGSSIRLGDLAGLQRGQILMLTRPAGSQLECLVNGKSKFRGEWIADGDRQGLQVDEVVGATQA